MVSKCGVQGQKCTRVGSAGVSAPLVSIDSFLESRPGSVSFVKIDVQGYELAVCQGMQATLRQNPDISIVLEFMLAAMRELGFDPSHVIGFFIERGKLTRGMPTVVKDSSYFDLLFSRHPFFARTKQNDETQRDKRENGGHEGSRHTRDDLPNGSASLCVASTAPRHCVSAAVPEQAFPHRRSTFPRNGEADRQAPGTPDGFHYLLEQHTKLHESLRRDTRQLPDGLCPRAHGH